ncbi:MAG: hypothetical protein CMR00_03685 [[Chlorobium] sp. 445]|nr:MAG: hypothetical protein CMR00_03685 [[Chlorobium] sp. 445]
MKKVSLLLVLCCLMRVVAAQVPQFEGTITMQTNTTSPDNQVELSATMIVYSKNGSTLIETSTNVGGMKMQQVTLARASEPNKLYTIDRKNKTYGVLDVTGMQSMQNEEEFEVKKIGTEKIRGMKCVHVQVKMKKSNVMMDMWTTKEIGDWEMYSRMQKNNPMFQNNKLLAALRKENADGMPLKTVVTVEGTRSVTEVTKVEKKALPASLFEIPSDYKESSDMFGIPGMSKDKMQEMMKQMMKQDKD